MRQEEEIINQQANPHSHTTTTTHSDMGNSNPSIGIPNPMGRSAAMPFSRLLQQIRRASGEDVEQESHPINPLTRTVIAFSLEAEHSQIDNRGRIVNEHNRPSQQDIPIY